MALWDLDQIKSYVRELTQKKGAAYPDADLENDINRYYFFRFPVEVQPKELLDWYKFNTVASTDTYTVDEDSVAVLQAPIYIDDLKARLWLDPNAFYAWFPQNQTYSEGRPQHALLYGGELILRNPPDAIYPVKIKAIVRPMTLTSGTATPTQEGWGPTIAYGTAIEKLVSLRDVAAAESLRPQFEHHKATLQQATTQQLFSGRVRPRF